jgi:hypothetical protein
MAFITAATLELWKFLNGGSPEPSVNQPIASPGIQFNHTYLTKRIISLPSKAGVFY